MKDNLDMSSERLTDASTKLLNVLAKGEGLKGIIEFGSKFLGNPMLVSDLTFNILGHSNDTDVNEQIWKDITQRGYYSYENVQYMKSSKMIETINQSSVPVYFKSSKPLAPDEKYGEWEKITDTYKIMPLHQERAQYSRAWSNIFLDNRIIGFLVVLEYYRPFEEDDFKFITLLSKAISIEIQMDKFSYWNKASMQDWFVADLLDGKIKDKEVVEERLKYINLHLKKSMYLLVVKPYADQINSIPIPYARICLEKITSSKSVLYNDYIVIILNRNEEKALSPFIEMTLKNFLKENEMVGGLSRKIHDIYFMNNYFTQALKAMEFGLKGQKQEVLFLYDDYDFQHLLDICSKEINLKNFCLSSIFILMEYDKKNDSDYMSSLWLYINNIKDHGNLANKLHIHRNTLSYRIKKIEEIMNVDLSNSNHLFRIHLSFKILEYMRYDLGTSVQNNAKGIIPGIMSDNILGEY